MELKETQGPREQTDAEKGLIALLNRIDVGWGDHFRQGTSIESGVYPIAGDENAGVANGVLEVRITPVGEINDDDEAIEPEALTHVSVHIELRLVGDEVPLHETTCLVPRDRDYRLSALDDSALLAILLESQAMGVSGILPD